MRLGAQHSFAAQLAEYAIEVNALEITVLRALSEEEGARSGMPIASMLKLCGTELVQKIAYAQVEAIGVHGAVGFPSIDELANGHVLDVGPAHVANVTNEALYRRSTTIYAGSSEIQRTIIAKALLGLAPGRPGNSAGTMSDLLSDSAQRYVDKSYDFAARTANLRGGTPQVKQNWAFFAELEWLGVGLPEDVGGLAGNPFDTAALLEIFGGALVIEPYVAGAVLAARAIAHAATAQQRRDLLPPLIDGERMIVLAHEEPDAGGRVEWIESRADRTAAGYTVSGRKALVMGAPLADQFVVAARTSSDAGDRRGISLF